MSNFNFNNYTKDIQLPSNKVRKILMQNYYQKSIEEIENIGVDINHLEKIFTDEAYYLAMKIVPPLEKKILYLTYIKGIRLNDICKRLKLSKKGCESIMPIRVLYKKAGLPPTVKIISNTFKLKKTIITKKLQIIPYQTLYIVCHDKKKINYRNLNITYTLNSIYGDLLLVNIDKKRREFKSLSQDEILWYTEDLIKKALLQKKN